MKPQLPTVARTKLLFIELVLLMIYTRKGRRLMKRRAKPATNSI